MDHQLGPSKIKSLLDLTILGEIAGGVWVRVGDVGPEQFMAEAV